MLSVASLEIEPQASWYFIALETARAKSHFNFFSDDQSQKIASEGWQEMCVFLCVRALPRKLIS